MIQYPFYSEDARVRIFSDLHLGHQKSYFQKAEQLLPLIQDCDIVICNGDTAETRQGKYYHTGIAERENLIQLCHQENKQLIIIGGNHDPDIETRAAFLEENSLFLMHGDAIFDSGAPWGREYLQNKSLILSIIKKYTSNIVSLKGRLAMAREIAAAVPAITSKEYGNNKLLNFLLHATLPPDRPIRILGAWILYSHLIEKFAKTYAPEAKIIITGHMHRRSVFHTHERIFINTGAFFKHAKPWVVDITHKKLRLLTVESSTPHAYQLGHSVASFKIN